MRRHIGNDSVRANSAICQMVDKLSWIYDSNSTFINVGFTQPLKPVKAEDKLFRGARLWVCLGCPFHADLSVDGCWKLRWIKTCFVSHAFTCVGKGRKSQPIHGPKSASGTIRSVMNNYTLKLVNNRSQFQKFLRKLSPALRAKGRKKVTHFSPLRFPFSYDSRLSEK